MYVYTVWETVNYNIIISPYTPITMMLRGRKRIDYGSNDPAYGKTLSNGSSQFFIHACRVRFRTIYVVRLWATIGIVRHVVDSLASGAGAAVWSPRSPHMPHSILLAFPCILPRVLRVPEVEETIVIESDLSPPCNYLIRHYSNITPVVECCTNHAI